MPKDPEEVMGHAAANNNTNQPKEAVLSGDDQEQAAGSGSVKVGAKQKNQDGDERNFKIGKKFYGFEDRFQPGRAWYHNVHNVG